jgi:hypothetical protein
LALVVAEKVGLGVEKFPQWLKPYLYWSTCGATEVAPFQNNGRNGAASAEIDSGDEHLPRIFSHSTE